MSCDLLNIIEKTYKIKIDKTGSLPRISCPFHSDNTPSFFIYPDTSSFYCFSCNTGGNTAKFVSLIDNISYKKACEKLNIAPSVSNGNGKYDKYIKRTNINFKILVANKTRSVLRKYPYIDTELLWKLLNKVKYFENTSDTFEVLRLRYKYFFSEILNLSTQKSKKILKIGLHKTLA